MNALPELCCIHSVYNQQGFVFSGYWYQAEVSASGHAQLVLPTDHKIL